MKIDKALIATIIFAGSLISGSCLWQYVQNNFWEKEIPVVSEKAITATFYCDYDKTISAKFTERKVSLVLIDGRELILPQTISGSGARYANSDESIVFWNKGDTAFIQEGELFTYENCTTKDE
ncbi:MliC family protein [bacterium]|jgi:membrane-bound inhibitor of C-type lysozyme|nr:MliC family protein [bacterium]